MENFSSERPRTPPRSSEQGVERSLSSTEESSLKPEGKPRYFGHVTDLIYPIRDAESATGWHIPSTYRETEAVDSSLLLGKGASFSASLQRIPAAAERTEEFTDLVPSHPLKLPAIIVEYAEHGTLAKVLTRNPNLSSTQRQFLALDVAQGLSALHQAGITHGDVKADNVLVCSHPDRQYIAKIADFGFSIVQEAEDVQIYVGGTRPWMAPEVLNGPVLTQNVPRTDTFSLGLLCWVIFLDGGSPVDCFDDDGSGSKTVHFEAVKAAGSLLEAALDVKKWLEAFAHAKSDQRIERALDAQIARYQDMPAKSSLDAEQMQRNRPLLHTKMLDQMRLTLTRSSFLPHLLKVFQSSLRHEPQERDLRAVIAHLKGDLPSFEGTKVEEHTTTANASYEVTNQGATRDSRIAGSSQSDKAVDATSDISHDNDSNSVPINKSTQRENLLSPITWSEQGFMYNWLSWQKIRELAPSIQSFVYDALSKETAAASFVVAALHMNGYGCLKDTGASLSQLRKSAEIGSHDARSYMCRIYAASLPANTDPNIIPGREYLYDYSVNGSRMAMAEFFRIANRDERERCWRYITDATGGVGAPWLNTDQMLHGFTQSQWIKDDWSLAQIQKAESPASLIINKRGDTILHFTAMCGRIKPFRVLMEIYKVDINIRNPLGETPTLAACRSGQGGIVIYCLKNYNADASLAAMNGETPLQWLCQFDDEYIKPLVADLIAHGADVEASTRENVRHSQISGSLDMDYTLPGTPLHWAVHHDRPYIVRILLDYGADPTRTAPGAVQSPLEWAAYWHNYECLKIIVEHQETKVTRVTTEGKPDLRHAVLYGPLVSGAIKAAEKYSMILRHGIEWLNYLHKTLDFLREKTKMINFSSRFQGSTLYYAVQGAHDEVVDYMFQHEWLIDTINKPVGDAKRTPVLEAVRWNRKPLCELLRDKDADVKALAANPFQPEKQNWSALHILAHEGHNKDVSLVEWLVKSGVPVDGRKGTHGATEDTDISSLTLDDLKAGIYSCETAFAVAIRRNAFNLANQLLRLGANPNILSFSSGMFTSSHPLTVLGHLIVANARYSTSRLLYLLNLSQIDFITEPERKLTAFHRAAMAFEDISRADSDQFVEKEDFDFGTNAEIMNELLLKWKGSRELNARCLIKGNTALHLAVASCNSGAVEALLQAGADGTILNDEGKSAKDLVKEVTDGTSEAVAKTFG